MTILAFARLVHNAHLDFAHKTLLLHQLVNIATLQMDMIAIQTLHVSREYALQYNPRLILANL